MRNSRLSIIALALVSLVAVSFFLGRKLEEETVLNAPKEKVVLAVPETIRPAPMTYRQLALQDILRMPFPEFYEALRAAPRAARQKWAQELETMRDNGRRTAAYSAYYKLLVQFDPREAAAEVKQIEDKKLRRFAYETIADAAPPFAMPELAECAIAVSEDSDSYAQGFEQVIGQWGMIDPLGAIRFFEQHPNERNTAYYNEIAYGFAALDPSKALSWIEQQKLEDSERSNVRSGFISGMFSHDRVDATKFALEHATDPDWQKAATGLIANLYVDSKAEAKLFFEQLPNDDAKRAAMERMAWLADWGTAEEVGQDRTPRAVAAFMTEFPPQYWKGELSSTLKGWVESSPQDLVEWIAQQPPETRDLVADEFASITDEKIDEVLAPVFALPDEQLRVHLVSAFIKNGGHADGPIQRAINTSALSPGQKATLLNLVAQFYGVVGEVTE